MPNVRKIGRASFGRSNCSFLQFASLKQTEYHSFEGCDFKIVSLSSFTNGATNSFYNCLSLKVFVALNLNVMCTPFFECCESLETVIIPNIEIRTNAFYKCKNLHTVLAKGHDFQCSCKVCPKCTEKFD